MDIRCIKNVDNIINIDNRVFFLKSKMIPIVNIAIARLVRIVLKLFKYGIINNKKGIDDEL